MSITQKLMSAAGVGDTGAWDLSTAAYSGVSFSVAAQETIGRSLFFKPDGLKMYVMGISGDDINEYNLSTAWDVSTASFLQLFSVAAQDTVPLGLFFKPDGTKMYVTGAIGQDVNEYNLSTAWDISTASFLQNFSVSAEDTIPCGIFFKSDGLKMYVVGNSGDDVNEYNLSTAWDVSSASFLQSFSVATPVPSPAAIFFREDGLKFYLSDGSPDDINEFDLSTAWDISTASFVQEFSASAQGNRAYGLFFEDNGLQMFVLNNSDVFSYTLGVQP